MKDKQETLRINKDTKHKVVYAYEQKGDINYAFVCGPKTHNLWVKVLEIHDKYIIAKVPIL